MESEIESGLQDEQNQQNTAHTLQESENEHGIQIEKNKNEMLTENEILFGGQR